MKLLFFSDARAEHTRRWTRFFALRGHDTHLVTWNSEHLDGYAPVTLHVIKKPASGTGPLARAINLGAIYFSVKRLIREIKPDVLHAHSMGSYSWLALATRFHPFVASPWGTDILVDAVRSCGNRWLTRRAALVADMIICDGRHIQDRLAEMDVPPAKMELVMFGTDVAAFSPRPDGERFVPPVPEWGDAPLVLSTRTLTPVHDVATFVRAIPEVLKRCPEARFVLAGGGSERPALEALADQLGVAPMVRFIGHLTEVDMARWLRAASVYVSSSLMDAGLAGSTAEAMACALPVVTTDNGDNAWWVKEGEGGSLVPNGDHIRMAEAVAALLKDKALCRKFGQFNRSVIVDKNNTSKEMARVESFYVALSGENR